jgi:CRISPR-associated protein Cas2
MLYLAAYDVSDPKRLQQALHVLRGYATGGQKSVFECFLGEAEKRALLAEVAAVLDLQEDRFFLVRLDPRSKVQTLGIAVRPADPSYFYVA